MNSKNKIGAVLGIMCMALTIGICIQIRTVKDYSTKIGQNYDQNNIRAEVLKYKEKYDNKMEKIENIDKILEDKIEQATTKNKNLEESLQEIKEGNKLIGLTEVTGPGIKIKLSDSKLAPNKTLDPNLLVIHDIDIFYIINELKNAGAEAISVNEQRIVPTSAIECGGNIITINGEKIGSPFLIKAIGLPENLANLDRVGGYLEAMRESSISVELKKDNNITIPKYSGIINYKYVKNAK